MKVGISSCSNGHKREWKDQLDELVKTLGSFGIEAVLSPHLYSVKDDYCGSDRERAEDLMDFYRDDSIDAIYDVSGGDLANGVLNHLDYDIIAKTKKEFWGYSDLTTVINAIYSQTGKSSVLYQIKNIVWENKDLQKGRFKDFLEGNEKALFDIKYDFLQGNELSGVVLGGNIRCFLKLAGTVYWPELKGRVLLLESLGGTKGQIATLFNQLDQMGVFGKINGIILGTFTRYEEEESDLSVYDLLKIHISSDLPVVKTKEIGHGKDSKAIRIGAGYDIHAGLCKLV